ncbi:MAG: amidohydrolase [Bacteroidota bacterium]
MLPLKVSLLQSPLHWQDPAANITHFDNLIRSGQPSDLWVLPEMFTSGFTMQPAKVAQEMDGEAVSWMVKTARELDTAIGGSLVITENGAFYNRFVFVKSSGEINTYDKRHLFTLAGEQNFYSAGEQRTEVMLKGWKISLQVCYDLRFPVFTRNSAANAYDLLIYVANWPEPRINAWSRLLVARAIENQCYVIGVNRTGNDDNGMPYNGQSAVIDPYGEYLVEPTDAEGVFSAHLDKDKLMDFREKFPVLKDADLFRLGFQQDPL